MRRTPMDGPRAGALALALFSGFIHAAPASASIVRVPADHVRIQSALLACQAGDTVLVSAGTYVENITWPGTQGICLRSESGPQATIIDGSNPSHPDTGSVIVLAAGQDTGTIIEGFTITRGTGTISPPLNAYQGGGILCVGASPTIQNNLITGNTERTAAGGGVFCMNASSPQIRGNTIRGNRAYAAPYGHGGGIFCAWGASATIVDNVITDNEGYAGCGIGLESTSSLVSGNEIMRNRAVPGESYGGGVHLWADTSTISGNTISQNEARYGAGLRIAYYSSPVISDNEISENVAAGAGGGILSVYYCAPILTGNDISDNAAGSGAGGGISYSFAPIVAAKDDGSLAMMGLGDQLAGAQQRAPRSYGRIANNYIVGNVGNGIRCAGGSPPIEHCRIVGNQGIGIVCDGGAAPEIHNNDIVGHSPYHGLHNAWGLVIVNAESNWWGDSSGPYHPTANPQGLGDRVSDFVDYEPWLMQSAAIADPAPVPRAELALCRNHPNPFNPTTTIEYVLPQAGAVTLRVYDVLGREVATLVDGVQSGGAHAIGWDASGKASGVYYYRIEAGNWSAVRPMVLAR